MNLQISKYRAFVETADCGNITRAAEKLHYTQSGISRMLLDLEAEWNLTLLERGKNGVRLTPDGVRLLPFARNVCQEADRLQAQVDDLAGLRAGMIRFAALSGSALELIAQPLSRFRQDYPAVEFELLTGDRKEIEGLLLSGQADIGLLTLPTEAELETVFLEQDSLVAVLPRNHPAAGAGVFPVAAFADEPFLMPETDKNGEIHRFLERCGLHPDISFSCREEYAVLGLTARGFGITLLPESALKNTAFPVCALPIDVPFYRSLGIAVRSRRSAALAVRRLLEYLR